MTIKCCKNCGNDFQILPEDKEFYRMMEVSEPTLCYICRMQRRLSYRNERYLYHRKCALTGKEIISCFSPDKPFVIYDIDAWWSDKWNPLDYGVVFDFSRPFFEQFYGLRECVPRLALQQQKPNWNSEYCNCMSQNKNCYLVFSTNRCEDCYYGTWVNDCRNCIDNLYIFNCELCYDCMHCADSYALMYSQDCRNCKNSYFLKHCIGCMDCFACSNLRNKQYYVFNKRKTKEEYEEFMKSVNMGSYQVVSDGKEKAAKNLHDLIVKEFHGDNLENSVGDYLYDCKNTYMSFSCNDCEDVRYSTYVEKAKNSMDHSHWGVNTERIYECQACGYDLFNLRFCNLCWSGCSDLTYCDHCFSAKNCFGCVGLKKHQYCILNKQYSKEEYEELVPRIIEHIKRTGEFGEYFSIAKSLFAYNEAKGYERVPMTKGEVLAKGWTWKDKDPRDYLPQKFKLADDIRDVPESVIDDVLVCETCEKNYKIIPQELSFYRKMTIPIPRTCTDCRHFERLKMENPYVLFDRKCAKCGKAIKTSYKEGSSEIVYCEECYLKEVYGA
ncbi:MAG: hypothetical protein WC285_04930 [Candidatus Gracilibacteria bacterium]